MWTRDSCVSWRGISFLFSYKTHLITKQHKHPRKCLVQFFKSFISLCPSFRFNSYIPFVYLFVSLQLVYFVCYFLWFQLLQFVRCFFPFVSTPSFRSLRRSFRFSSSLSFVTPFLSWSFVSTLPSRSFTSSFRFRRSISLHPSFRFNSYIPHHGRLEKMRFAGKAFFSQFWGVQQPGLVFALHAATCDRLRTLAATCSRDHLRPLAATCLQVKTTCAHLRPLKWLREALRVAAFWTSNTARLKPQLKYLHAHIHWYTLIYYDILTIVYNICDVYRMYTHMHRKGMPTNGLRSPFWILVQVCSSNVMIVMSDLVLGMTLLWHFCFLREQLHLHGLGSERRSECLHAPEPTQCTPLSHTVHCHS